MRNAFIVSYDISDPKRLRKVFKTMHGYGDRVQYSVFVCELSARDKIRMMSKLRRLIHHTEDQVLVINLGPAPGRSDVCIDSLGRKYEPIAREPVVA
jgi:CRISPR-associated protein Cas2